MIGALRADALQVAHDLGLGTLNPAGVQANCSDPSRQKVGTIRPFAREGPQL